MRILNVAAGVLLIAAGIYCLCNQDVALLSAGLLLGIFLLLSGVAEIVVFAATSGVMLGSGWLLLAVPAFQPVVHDAVAAVPVHAVAAVFRRVAVRQFV